MSCLGTKFRDLKPSVSLFWYRGGWGSWERRVWRHHRQVSGTFASVIASKPRPPILFKMLLLFCLQLLDDNRELFIPETQDTVVAHPMFMLFATQNPPGHYGGRKVRNVCFLSKIRLSL